MPEISADLGFRNAGNGLFQLRDTLKHSLDRIRGALEHANEMDAPSPGDLDLATTELKQVGACLTMVRCVGGQQLVGEMRALLQLLQDQAIRTPATALAALIDAALQLDDYIGLLAEGAADRAVVLRPVINALRVAGGRPVVSEAFLFETQVGPRVQAADASCMESPRHGTGDVRALAGQVLRGYQQHFVEWFQNRRASAAGEMARIADIVATVATTPAVRRLWWALARLDESLPAAPDTPIDLKRAVGRSVLELQTLARAGEAQAGQAALLNPATVLYWLLREPHRSQAAQRWIESLDLDGFLPDPAALAETRRQLHAPSSGILEQVHRELRHDLQSIKDGIELLNRSGGSSGPTTDVLARDLSRLGEALDMVGLNDLRQVLEDLAHSVRGLDPDDARWLDVAAELVRVETSLESTIGDGREESDGKKEDVTLARTALLATVNESLRVLGTVTDALNAADAQHDAGPLAAVDTPLVTVASILRVAGHAPVSEALRSLGAVLQQAVALPTAPDSARINLMADLLTSIVLYLEALRDGVPRPQAHTARIKACLERLHSEESEKKQPEATAQASPVPRVAAVPAPREAPDALPLPESHTPVRSLDESPTVLPDVPEEKARDGTPVQSDGPRLPDGVDPELLDIFLEEAGDISTQLPSLLGQVEANPGNLTAATDFRRAFHTLKGSGRAVGASGIGEFAWAIEHLLNGFLESRLPLTTDVLAVSREAIAWVPRLVEALRDGDLRGASLPEAMTLAMRADRIRLAHSVAANPPAETPVLSASAPPAGPDLSVALEFVPQPPVSARSVPAPHEDEPAGAGQAPGFIPGFIARLTALSADLDVACGSLKGLQREAESYSASVGGDLFPKIVADLSAALEGLAPLGPSVHRVAERLSAASAEQGEVSP